MSRPPPLSAAWHNGTPERPPHSTTYHQLRGTTGHLSVVPTAPLPPAAWHIATPCALPPPSATTYRRALGAAFCFHAYQQVSYLILQRVSPVTHSIGNCVKRVVVILASIIVFQNPVTPQGAAGTTLALVGVFLYSQAKRMGKTKKE